MGPSLQHRRNNGGAGGGIQVCTIGLQAAVRPRRMPRGPGSEELMIRKTINLSVLKLKRMKL
jgi:hypothetical protein